MKVTKSQIIEAIKTEPLRAGSWYSVELNGSCLVCAVGAVLRNACKMDYFNIERFASANYKTNTHPATPEMMGHLLENNRHMEALSCFFEDACAEASWNEDTTPENISKESMSEIRKLTVDFVEEYFPDEVSI